MWYIILKTNNNKSRQWKNSKWQLKKLYIFILF